MSAVPTTAQSFSQETRPNWSNHAVRLHCNPLHAHRATGKAVKYASVLSLLYLQAVETSQELLGDLLGILLWRLRNLCNQDSFSLSFSLSHPVHLYLHLLKNCTPACSWIQDTVNWTLAIEGIFCNEIMKPSKVFQSGFQVNVLPCFKANVNICT